MSDWGYWNNIEKLKNSISKHVHYNKYPEGFVENLKGDNSKEAQDLLTAYTSYVRLLNDYDERHQRVKNSKRALENTWLKRQQLKKSLPMWGTRSNANINANTKSKTEKTKMRERARNAIGFHKAFQQDDILEAKRNLNAAYKSYKAQKNLVEQAQPVQPTQQERAEQARRNAQAASQEAYRLIEKLQAERAAREAATKAKSQGGSRKRTARSRRKTHRRKTHRR